MVYNEISKFLNFLQTELIIRNFKKAIPTEEDLVLNRVIYPIKPVITEIRENFVMYLDNEIFVSQLNQDYKKYVSLIAQKIDEYENFGYQIMDLVFAKELIEIQLDSPTFLQGFMEPYESILSSSILSDISEYNDIFSSETGYRLFVKLHEVMQPRDKYNADYSFMFYAMSKDNYIICNGADWIKWLGKTCDIHIDRIDSRYKEDTTKFNLYNAFKSGFDN